MILRDLGRESPLTPEDHQNSSDKSDFGLNDNAYASLTKTKAVGIQVRNLSIGSLRSGGISKSSTITKLIPFIGNDQKQKSMDIESNDQIKTILYPLSFDIPKDTLTCLIGGSGSGKTTLLNSLADRHFANASLVKTGSIIYQLEDCDGRPLVYSSLLKVRNAYVIQQEILIPTLTCFETLMFAAELKLSKSTNHTDRLKLVNEIILELGLKDCKDTLIGNKQNKGLSGGEKRRLSVGLQLVSNPSILFLDEPTTGLDSYNAYLLCLSLKKLAHSLGKTIIMSAHQPRTDIFKLFDRVLILSKGKLCYGDSYDNIFDHFANIGFEIPEVNTNPADYLVDITSVDTKTFEKEEESKKIVAAIIGQWKTKMESINAVSTNVTESSIISPIKQYRHEESLVQDLGRAPLLREINILVRRNLKLQLRDPIGYFGIILEAILLGLICGWIFFKPGSDLVGIRSVEAALYTSSSLQCYLFLLFEIYRLCQSDLKIYDRERSEGSISIVGFLISRRISKFITEDFSVPLIFSIITYFMYGLRTDSAKYFWKYFAGNLVFHLNTLCWGMAAATLSRDVSIATLIGNLNFTFQSLCNGFFINAEQMPVYVRWCKYVAYLWYSLGYFISNEFTGFEGASCLRQHAGDPEVDTLCEAYSGRYIIKSLGYWENWNALPICVVLAWAIGMYLLSGVILKFKPVDITMGKEVKSKEDLDNKNAYQDMLFEIDKKDKEEGVTVTIKHIYLTVYNKLKKSRKEILLDVDAVFESGKLNIIMGPSGSGKTSLLNLLSGRLNSNLATKYTSSGRIYLNNFEIEDYSIIRPVCSYVIQDDDHLLPSLTVKETLGYAAKLRLSKNNLSRDELNRLVDSVILQMGLKECADTLVGNELLKGISGGEKRRLTIAIQLISSPKILILDEPTSGLDSFTAESIIDCLERLANNGTTIIMTIHQPRSLDRFGSVLLLAKGGQVAYNGNKEGLIRNFDEMGFKIPKLTNLADFFIDMISYNTSSEEIELKTRKRVNSIIEYWKTRKTDIHVENVVPLNSKEELRKQFHSYIKEPADFLVGLAVLTDRQWTGLIRDPNILMARCAQVIGLGVILTLFFARLKHTYSSVQNRLGLIQQIVSLYFTGMLNNMASYTRERDYFYDEFNDDVVRADSFFFSYLIIELPFEFLTCVAFSVLLVFAVGFQYDAGLFFAMVYSSMMVVNAGESLGISFNTVFDHPGFALTIISIFCSIGVCMAGLLAMTLDKFMQAMNYLSPSHYTVMIITNLVFTEDLKLYCTESEKLSDGSCLFNTGKDVLDAYNLKINLKLYFCLLALLTVIHRIISYVFLRLKQARIHITKHKKYI